MRKTILFTMWVCTLALLSQSESFAKEAAPKKGNVAEPAVALTDASKALETKYAAMQTALEAEVEAEVEAALPKRDDAKIAAWLEAIKAEEVPAQEADEKAGAVAKMQGTVGNLRELEANLKNGPKTLEDGKAELERAKARGENDPENAKLIEQLLANEPLMVQMLVADGPTAGKFGMAMKIYADIQKASPKAKEGIFQRLAVAVSLAHAVPIMKQVPSADDDADVSDPTDSSANDASKLIDPVKRYLSYEKWYLDGELDQGFKDLSVWSLTMVVNGEEPDEVHVWGHQMLNNLRPDCIPNHGDTSVYVEVVDKEIRYSSASYKSDLPERQFMENILANGGICGRRAFFGRFILRAFGIPTAARKQPEHATLGHWHPDGWLTSLGEGRWGKGARSFYSAMNDNRTKPYGADVNFLASTQARENATAFMWDKTAPVVIELKAGKNVLKFHGPARVTFGQFTLTPVN